MKSFAHIFGLIMASSVLAVRVTLAAPAGKTNSKTAHGLSTRSGKMARHTRMARHGKARRRPKMSKHHKMGKKGMARKPGGGTHAMPAGAEAPGGGRHAISADVRRSKR